MSERQPDNVTETITVSILVPAAGCGTRTGLPSNKVLAPLHARPLLYWTIRALLHPAALPPSCRAAEIVIAARREEWDEIDAALAGLPLEVTRQTAAAAGFDSFRSDSSSPPGSHKIPCRLVEGGKDRQSSVAQAARVAQGSFLLVHDAARPLLSPALIKRVCTAALRHGAAIAALPCSDTPKRAIASAQDAAAAASTAAASTIAATVDRDDLWLAQTPQIFRRALLLEAQHYAAQTGFTGTDCASLLEHQPGQPPVALVEGDPLNFKVTYAADVTRAEHLLPLIDGFRDSFDDTLKK